VNICALKREAKEQNKNKRRNDGIKMEAGKTHTEGICMVAAKLLFEFHFPYV